MNKKKVGKVIAVCAVAVLVTAIVIALNFFIPKHIFQEKIDKVTQMGDIQYSLEVTKTVGGDKNGVELAGFYLPTAKQFSANVAEIADGTKKDTSSLLYRYTLPIRQYRKVLAGRFRLCRNIRQNVWRNLPH